MFLFIPPLALAPACWLALILCLSIIADEI